MDTNTFAQNRTIHVKYLQQSIEILTCRFRLTQRRKSLILANLACVYVRLDITDMHKHDCRFYSPPTVPLYNVVSKQLCPGGVITS